MQGQGEDVLTEHPAVQATFYKLGFEVDLSVRLLMP